MRGPIYPKFCVAVGLLSLTGCAAGVDPGPTPESGRAGRPTTTLSDQSDGIENVKAIVHHDSRTGDSAQMEIYRDAAMFVYIDGNGKQILQQWLLDETGEVYFLRACRVGDKGGVLWNTCSAWDNGHHIADLGLPEFGSVSGMNTYVWVDQNGSYKQQWLAQTVYNERGDMRMGRVCPIVREPLWKECTDWNKFASSTEHMAVPGANAIRDDFYFSYRNADDEAVLVQNVLSIDGSLMWNRECVTQYASPFVPSYKCGFSDKYVLKNFGIGLTAMAGGAQYVYHDGAEQKLGQSFFSVDGTKSYHRVCTVTPNGVNWSECEPFTANTLVQARLTQTPL